MESSGLKDSYGLPYGRYLATCLARTQFCKPKESQIAKYIDRLFKTYGAGRKPFNRCKENLNGLLATVINGCSIDKKALAKEAGVSIASINRWVQDITCIGDETFKSLCKAVVELSATAEDAWWGLLTLTLCPVETSPNVIDEAEKT